MSVQAILQIHPARCLAIIEASTGAMRFTPLALAIVIARRAGLARRS